MKNEKRPHLLRLGFAVAETIKDSRCIMKKDNRKYYAAYEERYKTAHSKGVSWSSNVSTPIVMEVIDKYNAGNRMRRRQRFQNGIGAWLPVNGNGYFRRSDNILQSADASV